MSRLTNKQNTDKKITKKNQTTLVTVIQNRSEIIEVCIKMFT